MEDRREAFNGELNWIEIATTDLSITRNFMQKVFNYEELEYTEEIGYSQMGTNDGFRLFGLHEVTSDKEGEKVGVKCYFATEDAEKTTKLVEENGGTVVVPPKEIFGNGIMATFLDPEGAAFGCWQPLKHRGIMKYVNDDWQIGYPSWIENNTVDASVTKPFYCAVFGTKCIASPTDNYELYIVNDEISIGGVSKTESDPNWALYINVASVLQSIETVKELGGSVLLGPISMPTMTFAVISDPQGVSISIASEEGDMSERLATARRKSTLFLTLIDDQAKTLESIRSLSESNDPDLSQKILALLDTKSAKKRPRENDTEENPILKKSKIDEE